jgi:hypothetical protein
MDPHSNLDHIQTTIPPLIAESSFEVYISWGLTFLGPLSISVQGTSQLNQSFSMPTMHQPVKYDKVRSLCLRQDVSWDRPTSRGLQSFQVSVQLTVLLSTSGNPWYDLGRNCASRSTFLGPMWVYNGREHGTASASPCSHRAGNWPKCASPNFWG